MYYNPVLLKIQEQARDYLGRNVISKAPKVKGYEKEVREFISGRIVDEQLSIVPATENQKKILKQANLIEQEDLDIPYSKTFIIRDKDTGQFRGAIHIVQREVDDEIDDFDDRFPDLFSIDNDEDEEEEEEERPKETIIKYYDVSPDGSNVERAVKKILQTPHGYCIKTSSLKIIKQPVNESFINKFIY